MHAPVKIIPSELLLTAYRSGIFPMADSRDDDDVYWVEPRERAVIPLEPFRVSRSLAKAVRQDRFRVTCNADFAGVVEHLEDLKEKWPLGPAGLQALIDACRTADTLPSVEPLHALTRPK